MDLLAAVWSELQRDPLTSVLLCVVVTLSYTAQALTGFGGAALGMPAMSAFKRIPIASAVPIFSLLDLVGGFINFWKFCREAVWSQIAILLLPMFVGTTLGVLVLEIAPNHMMMGLLGIFVIATSLMNLFGVKGGLLRTLPPRAGLIVGACFGIIGGGFGGMFGTGGPIYALYLSNRLDPSKAVSTLGTFLAMSAFVRATIFYLRGAYTSLDIVVLACVAIPFVIATMLITHAYRARVSARASAGILQWILLAVGISLIVRASGL
jgi:uncharacterized membrane protein YfcA